MPVEDDLRDSLKKRWMERRAPPSPPDPDPKAVQAWKAQQSGPLPADEDFRYDEFVRDGGVLGENGEFPAEYFNPGAVVVEGRDISTGKQVYEDSYTGPGPAVAGDDKRTRRIFGILDWVGAAGKSVVRGALKGAGEAAGLAADATSKAGEALGLSEEEANLVNPSRGLEYLAKTGAESVPFTYEDGSVGQALEHMGTGLSQFVIPYTGATKAVRLRNAATWAERVTKEMLAGAAVDAVVFDPAEGNLSTFLRDLGIDNEITQMLDSGAKEDEIQGRIANAVEGALTGFAVGEVAIPSVKLASRLIADGATKLLSSARGSAGSMMPANQAGRLGVQAEEGATEAMGRYFTEEETALVTPALGERLDELFAEAGTGGIASVDELAAMARAGELKRGWYENSAKALAATFGEDAPRFISVLAALSPRTSVESNLSNALSLWKAWKAAGEPLESEAIAKLLRESAQGENADKMDAWLLNTITALRAEDPLTQRLSGPKVESFRKNLLGNPEEVTLDAWMATATGIPQEGFAGISRGGEKGLKGGGYIFGAAEVRRAAEVLTERTGETWTPAEVQETVWSWVKSIYELRGSRPGSTIGELADDPGLPDRIGDTPEFGILFGDEKHRSLIEDAGYAIPDQEPRKATQRDLDAAEREALGAASERIERTYRERRAGSTGLGLARRAGRGDPGDFTGGPYARTGEEDGGSARLEPDDQTRAALENIGAAAPPYIESDAEAFKAAIEAGKSANPAGASVYIYDDYSGMKTFLTEDGSAGFAVNGDDIVSVFKTPGQHPHVTLSMLTLAVQAGGRRLDAFDTVLPELYSRSGFVPVARMGWDDAYAPDGWDREFFTDFNDGEPDVVYMAYMPDLSKKERAAYFKASAREGQYVDTPEEAVTEQDAALAGAK